MLAPWQQNGNLGEHIFDLKATGSSTSTSYPARSSRSLHSTGAKRKSTHVAVTYDRPPSQKRQNKPVLENAEHDASAAQSGASKSTIT